MIRILHGENIVASRKALVYLIEEARKAGNEVASFAAQKTNLSEIRQALESNSLLGKNRLVVLENLLSGQKSKEKSKILAYLEKGNFNNDLILWEEKEVKLTRLFPKAKTENFKLDPLIFHFLDSLRPGDAKQMLSLLMEVKKREEPEMIFYMLGRQFRFLILAKDLGTSGLSELPLWQQKKFLNLAKNFSLEKLRDIYRKLLEIDFSQKTSSDGLALSSRLDLLISEI